VKRARKFCSHLLLRTPDEMVFVVVVKVVALVVCGGVVAFVSGGFDLISMMC
jgi:hypothetical protein